MSRGVKDKRAFGSREGAAVTPGVAAAKLPLTDLPVIPGPGCPCPRVFFTGFPVKNPVRGLLFMSSLVASLVQNLVELLQLPGLEEDRAFQKEIGLRTLVFKAYR